MIRPVVATLAAAFAGWLAIGVWLSITVPFAVPGATAEGLFQWDASNFYGAEAFKGGWGMAAIGALADFFVSLAWAAIAALLLARSEQARRYPAIFGVVFGSCVMGIMLYGVVPLGQAHQGHPTLLSFANNFAAHTVFFGLPVALVGNRLLFARDTAAD